MASWDDPPFPRWVTCAACGLSVHPHDIHYCPAATTTWPTGETQNLMDALKVERDRAREECGHEKRMRQSISAERDHFIRKSMALEWLLAEARWHAQGAQMRSQWRCHVCNEPIPAYAALCARPHSAAGVTFDGRTWYPTPNTISASGDE